MKKLLLLFSAAFLAFAGCTGEMLSDPELKKKVEDLEDRVTKLEEQCRRMNDDISSIRTIVEAIADYDYITGDSPVK